MYNWLHVFFFQEKSLRESQEERRTQSISEVVAAQEKEKALAYELEKTKDLLKTEQDRSKHYMEQVSAEIPYINGLLQDC